MMEHYENIESSRDSLRGRMITNKVLTDLDKKILYSEGLSVSPNTSLTKAQEFTLKKVRRKLKNKISAQESRRKKKEYLENLEKRVRMLDVENNLLRRSLETQDQTLRSLKFQMHKLKSPVEHKKKTSYQSKGTQTGICLKCYQQKQAAQLDDPIDEFTVQTGINGRIVVRSDSLEEQDNALSQYKSEYTDFRNIMHHSPYDSNSPKRKLFMKETICDVTQTSVEVRK